MLPYVEPDADAAAADPEEDPELAPEAVAPEDRNGLRQTGQELFCTVTHRTLWIRDMLFKRSTMASETKEGLGCRGGKGIAWWWWVVQTSTSQGLMHASWNLCPHGSKTKLSPALKSSWHTEQPTTACTEIFTECMSKRWHASAQRKHTLSCPRTPRRCVQARSCTLLEKSISFLLPLHRRV